MVNGAGAVVTVLLVMVWIGSVWYGVSCQFSQQNEAGEGHDIDAHLMAGLLLMNAGDVPFPSPLGGSCPSGAMNHHSAGCHVVIK